MMNFRVVAAGLVGQNIYGGEKEHLVTTDKFFVDVTGMLAAPIRLKNS